MKYYYKITKEQADNIGKFEYDKNKQIDPFVGQQIDGTYLISEKLANDLKGNKNLNQIDFSKCEIIDEEKAKASIIIDEK